MNFENVMELIQVILLPLLGLLVYEIRKLRESVEDLSKGLAVAATKIQHIENDHGRRIERLEERLP